MAGSVPLDLVEAARTGGPPEVERLIEAVWPDAYRLARAALGEAQAAQDCAQEACIILYRSIASLRTSGAFRVWFYRIVMQQAVKLKRRGPVIESAPDERHESVDPAMGLDIWRALSALPLPLRNVVVLKYFEDLPSREIAAILGVAHGTVRFRLSMAKRRLRPLLGGDDATAPASPKVGINAT